MKKIATIYLLGIVMLGACSKSDDQGDPNGGGGGNNGGTEIRGTITTDSTGQKTKHTAYGGMYT